LVSRKPYFTAGLGRDTGSAAFRGPGRASWRKELPPIDRTLTREGDPSSAIRGLLTNTKLGGYFHNYRATKKSTRGKQRRVKAVLGLEKKCPPS